MRQIILAATATAVALWDVASHGATVTYRLIDAGADPALVQSVRFVPVRPDKTAAYAAVASNTVLPYAVRSTPDTNAVGSVFLVGGFYDTYFGNDTTLPPLRILVAFNDTNTYTLNQVAQLAVNAGMFGLASVTITNVSGGGGGTSTNVAFATNASYATYVTGAQSNIIAAALTNNNYVSQTAYGLQLEQLNMVGSISFGLSGPLQYENGALTFNNIPLLQTNAPDVVFQNSFYVKTTNDLHSLMFDPDGSLHVGNYTGQEESWRPGLFMPQGGGGFFRGQLWNVDIKGSSTIASSNVAGLGTAATVNTNTLLQWAAALGPTNLPPNLASNIVCLWPNGTNDMTATIQAALDKPGSIIWLYPGQTYYATNLWIRTNDLTIRGNGARLLQLKTASQTNYVNLFNTTNILGLLVYHTNSSICRNTRIYDLILDGDSPNRNGVAYKQLNWPLYMGTGINPAPLYPTLGYVGATNCGNHNGLVFNQNADGVIQNCIAQNFDSAGFWAFSDTDLKGQLTQKTLFIGNAAYTNFCGFHASTTGWNSFTPYKAPDYMNIAHFVANQCGVGIDCKTWNHLITDCILTECYIGLIASPSHSKICNVVLNHDTCGFILANDNTGESIDGLFEAATGTNFIAASTGNVRFNSCAFGNTFIDSSQVEFRGCSLANFTVTNSQVAFINNNTLLTFTNSADFTNVICRSLDAASTVTHAGNNVWTNTALNDGVLNADLTTATGLLPMGTLSQSSTNNTTGMLCYWTDGTRRYTSADGRGLTNVAVTVLQDWVVQIGGQAGATFTSGRQWIKANGGEICNNFTKAGFVFSSTRDTIVTNMGSDATVAIGAGTNLVSYWATNAVDALDAYSSTLPGGATNYVLTPASTGSFLVKAGCFAAPVVSNTALGSVSAKWLNLRFQTYHP